MDQLRELYQQLILDHNQNPRNFREIENYPIKPNVKPGDIYKQFPSKAPLNKESFETIFNDFKKIILPGITHWQNPNFHAFFPANNSYPSILAEM